MSNSSLQSKPSWQKALADLITDPEELWDLLELDKKLLPEANQAVTKFSLRIPRTYVGRIEKGNINDPLLKQILPLGVELKQLSGYTQDPLEEKKANIIPGLLHKYHGRVLITLTSACAIHCRYCFRRHFAYTNNQLGKKNFQQIIQYIEQDKTLNEVILSGGDPLAVNDQLLWELSEALNKLSHVKRLRIHTRLPIILPSRITDSLLTWFDQLQQHAIVVFHVNHFKELDHEVSSALMKLYQTGVTLLNQAVLLKGINDEVDILVRLSEQLFAARVMPYYLHVLDKVEGAHHFDVEEQTARKLHEQLCLRLPGYLVPKLVREEAGAGSKTWLG